MTRYVAAVLGLTSIYALALASFYPVDLFFGAALSAALVFVSRGFVFGEVASVGPSRPRRVVAFFPFALVTVWEVALVTLHLRPLEGPGIVEATVGERTPAGVTAWAPVVGLTPGPFFVDGDPKRGVVLSHFMDASDPDAYRREQEDSFRRYQSKVFP